MGEERNAVDVEVEWLRQRLREAKRRKAAIKAARKWDKAHTLTCGAKVPRETAEQFMRLCEENGTTRHAVIAAYIKACLSAQKIYF
jgi:hypothetical protein